MKNLKQLLELVVLKKGTDLHVVAGAPPAIRVNGLLLPVDHEILTPEMAEEICMSVLKDSPGKSFQNKDEIDIGFGIKGFGRFRANIFRQKGCISGAFRFIPERVPPFPSLGLPAMVGDLTLKKDGLLLVTGPTGSGKSTTIASLLDKINDSHQGHIVTIEDPIEYVHAHKKSIVNQREVGLDTVDFGVAMKYLLRQDPDFCLVGEIRDHETAITALKLSETGHLVFATLHTNSAADTIDRILSMFDSREKGIIQHQLASIIRGVLSQQLLPGLDGNLVLAYELLIPTPGIRALIREGKVYQVYSMMQVGQNHTGMVTMNQSLMNLLMRRKIDMKVGFEASPDPEELNEMLTKAGL